MPESNNATAVFKLRAAQMVLSISSPKAAPWWIWRTETVSGWRPVTWWSSCMGMHSMCSGQVAARSFPQYEIADKIRTRGLSPLRAGGGGAASRFVCGYKTSDP